MANRRPPSEAGVPSAYAGGYSEAIKRQLESVPLPDKIKCKNCKKFRNANVYSKRQLDIFRNAFVVGGQRALTGGYATCRGCTGGQIMELRCCVCDKVKGLEEFAINQRKEHEFARCLDCVQGHKDAEPVVDENKLLTEGDPSTLGALSFHTGSTLGGSIRQLTSDAQSHGSSFAGVTDNVPSGGGVWIEPERHETNNPSSHGSQGRADLGSMNANSAHSEWASYGVARSLATGSVRNGGEDDRFPKVKAWRSETVEKQPARVPEMNRNASLSDDEEDDEDVSGFL
ncbi:uncharacterized protein BDV17DRAFT_108754 [Aspergillus undulatus]|uniref:uncharacterized protein n=1 Tax=Aspergillus undulatus TaxID=1810928 RepID=UPI003CCD8110